MEWILDKLYLVAIAGYFLFSFLGRSGKSDDKPTRMPTFGNERRNERQPSKRAEPADQHAGPGKVAESTNDSRSRRETREEEYVSPYHEQQEYRNPYEDSASRMESAARELSPQKVSEGLDDRKRQMQRDLEGVFAELDQTASRRPSPLKEEDSMQEERGLSKSQLQERATQGVIWSEILGPPRAKRPLGRRR
ncbi:hypothetical protein JJQ72_04595 [Paenibacillus sp. F411]|uniref:Uncharacterized protein n=1 Tax=Paenibacillus algicola TaxID=2565926 RepID=A0A4P8XHZ0_9BACL|nr:MULTISPECIES: hypothetical protein [Paenibacillus]MBO2943259.1 hypothetical protein [Paenibacillus sp. F411]QCT02182.1 hypothetical protein E6C60_1466 [Paenibacillus algicola]